MHPSTIWNTSWAWPAQVRVEHEALAWILPGVHCIQAALLTVGCATSSEGLDHLTRYDLTLISIPDAKTMSYYWTKVWFPVRSTQWSKTPFHKLIFHLSYKGSHPAQQSGLLRGNGLVLPLLLTSHDLCSFYHPAPLPPGILLRL